MAGRTKYTAQDFFAGSGLVSLALSSRYKIVFANDISEDKAEIYKANRKRDKLELKDIAELDGANIPAADLSWASFPCQDLSLAGAGAGLNGQRSSLVYEWLRLIGEMEEKPPVLVAENVTGFVSRNGGRDAVVVCTKLQEMGYAVGIVMLDAIMWVPQSRKRVFLIAARADKSEIPEELTTDGPKWQHAGGIDRVAAQVDGWIWWNLPQAKARRDGLDSIIEDAAPWDDGTKTERLINMLSDTQAAKLEASTLTWHAGYKRTRQGQQRLELRYDNIAGCLRTAGGGSSKQIIIKKDSDGYKSRLMTCREAARLMGAPDTFKLPEDYNKAYNAMGDAVCVPVARYLSEKLLYPLTERMKAIRDDDERQHH